MARSTLSTARAVAPRAIVVGVAAFALVFVGAVEVAGGSAERQFRTTLEDALANTTLGDQVVRLAFTGDAHFAPVAFDGVSTFHPIFSANVEFAAAVPVLSLLAAGALLADASDWAASGWRGSAVALGYVPAAVVAHFTFRTTTEVGSLTIAPALAPYVIATVGHAVVFGALGGLLGYAATTDREVSLERVVDAAPLRAGALGGVAAYATSYVSTYTVGRGLLRVDHAGAGIVDVVSDTHPWVDGSVNAAAYFFYNAQHVPLSPVTTFERPANFVHSDYVVWVVSRIDVLHVVPLLALVGSGYVVARRTGRGVVAGGSIAVGYGTLALAGIVVFTSSGADGMSVRPEPLVTVLHMGLVAPLLLGGVGGLLADR